MKRNFVILIFIFFLFYKWTATSSCGLDFKHDDSFNPHVGYGSYNLLAEAFKKKRLDLEVDLPVEFKLLADPYNPDLNKPYRDRIHDLSYYKGKLYLYFGPTPVITLFLPYLLITGKQLPNNFSVFLFCFGTFIFSGLILFHLRNIYFKNFPDWLLTLAIANIGASNLSPYLLRQPRIWEQADSCGMFFISGAIYFLFRAIENEHKLKSIYLTLGSLFLGLSIGGRPQYVLSSVLLLIVFYKIRTWKITYKHLISLFGPCAICMILLGLYNYFRFEDPFNFGITYQLASYNLRKEGVFGNQYILPSGYFYLFQPPVINSFFPFIYLDPSFPSFITRPNVYFLEKVGGIFPCVPFLFILIFSPILKQLAQESRFFKNIYFPKFEFLILILPPLINLLIILRINCGMMRHNSDYLNLLLLSTSLIWFYIYCSLENKSAIRNYLTAITVVLIVISMFIGLGMSIHGQYEGLLVTNNGLYNDVLRSFSWLSKILHYIAPLWGQK